MREGATFKRLCRQQLSLQRSEYGHNLCIHIDWQRSPVTQTHKRVRGTVSTPRSTPTFHTINTPTSTAGSLESRRRNNRQKVGHASSLFGEIGCARLTTALLQLHT